MRGEPLSDEHSKGFIQVATSMIPLPQRPVNILRMFMKSQDNQVRLIEGKLRQRKRTVPGRARQGRSLQVSFLPPLGDWSPPSWAKATEAHRQPRKTPPNRTLEPRGGGVEAGGFRLSPEDTQQLSLQPGPQ